MKILLADGTEIENIAFCAITSFDGSLVFEIVDVDPQQVAELVVMLNEPERTESVTAVSEGSADAEYTGYTWMKSMGYDGNRNTLTVFLSRMGDPSPLRKRSDKE